jgi:hypothetical protein
VGKRKAYAVSAEGRRIVSGAEVEAGGISHDLLWSTSVEFRLQENCNPAVGLGNVTE